MTIYYTPRPEPGMKFEIVDFDAQGWCISRGVYGPATAINLYRRGDTALLERLVQLQVPDPEADPQEGRDYIEIQMKRPHGRKIMFVRVC